MTIDERKLVELTVPIDTRQNLPLYKRPFNWLARHRNKVCVGIGAMTTFAHAANGNENSIWVGLGVAAGAKAADFVLTGVGALPNKHALQAQWDDRASNRAETAASLGGVYQKANEAKATAYRSSARYQRRKALPTRDFPLILLDEKSLA